MGQTIWARLMWADIWVPAYMCSGPCGPGPGPLAVGGKAWENSTKETSGNYSI